MNDEVGSPAPAGAPILGAKRAFYSFVVFFVPQVAAGVIVTLARSFGSSAERTASGHAPSGVALMLAGFVGMILGGLLVLHYARRSMPGPIKSGALVPIGWVGVPKRALWPSAGVGALLVLLYMAAMAVFPPTADQEYGVLSELLKSGGATLHIWALGAVLVAPPVEELVFRGVLLRGFSRSWGIWAASIVVSVLFLSLHLTETLHYLPALLVQILFSIATVVARIASRSLLPSIALHATYNAGVVAIVYVSWAIMH
jgi:membrane protease YdiL (CAAX protease family)